MFCELASWHRIFLALALAFAVSFAMVPQVKRFAESVGAIDQPSARRINDHPIPRMGGISIFCGFVLAVLAFAELTAQVKGIMIGAIIIAVMGALDDVFNLNPWVKLVAQIGAAIVCVSCGVMIDAVSTFTGEVGFLQISHSTAFILTVIWIVGCTNAINLIDGLDGLAVGMSAISAATLFVISLEVADANVSVILACLIGGCVGFWPYNKHPAKIFMGDVGSQMLGFVLSSVSVVGLFKMHALVTMLIPVLAMAVPISDTAFAFIRRILRGQSPFHADKGHFHHRLLALGLTQSQAVIVLYSISIVLGIFAYLMVGETRSVKVVCLVVAFLIVFGIVLYVFRVYPHQESAAQTTVEEDVKIYRKGKKKK